VEDWPDSAVWVRLATSTTFRRLDLIGDGDGFLGSVSYLKLERSYILRERRVWECRWTGRIAPGSARCVVYVLGGPSLSRP